MNHHKSEAGVRDVWVKMGWIWSLIFVLAVLVSTRFHLQSIGFPSSQSTSVVWIAFFLIFWHLGAMALFSRIGNARQYPRLGILYTAVLIILWFLLVQTNAIFYLVLFGLFSQIFWMLALKSAAGMTIATTLFMIYQQTIGSGEPLTWEIVVVYLLFAGGSIGLGFWINAIINQSNERKLLINQLQSTQADLAKVEHKAGILAERQRLAHDIHDTLAQGFITIIMQLETAVPLLSETNKEATKHILRAKQAARDNLAQARRVVQDLRPQSLEETTLPEAIKQVAAKWERQSRVETAVIITGHIQPLSAKVETTLLRVAQESLTNISKHARANKASITLSYTNDTIMLDIQDDGIGYCANNNQQENHSSGYGLVAMRERVKQQNGTLSIESEQDEGTTLIAHIPILPKN